MVLFHYPDTWLDFAGWHAGGGGAGPAAAAAVLEKGRGALPEALALHFAAADLQVGAGGGLPDWLAGWLAGNCRCAAGWVGARCFAPCRSRAR